MTNFVKFMNSVFPKYSYDLILAKLEEEFFISQRRIEDIIKALKQSNKKISHRGAKKHKSKRGLLRSSQ